MDLQEQKQLSIELFREIEWAERQVYDIRRTFEKNGESAEALEQIHILEETAAAAQPKREELCRPAREYHEWGYKAHVAPEFRPPYRFRTVERENTRREPKIDYDRHPFFTVERLTEEIDLPQVSVAPQTPLEAKHARIGP